MKQFFTPRTLFVISAILIASFTRLIPHPYNFTAIGAIALFGGAVISDRRIAFFLPLAAMFLADLFIGFHASMPFVYGAFILITMLGMRIRNNRSAGVVFGSSILSSLLFFLITNFGVWIGDPLYPQNISGLIACYAAALPFYDHGFFGNLALNTVMGDLFFNALLFGSLYLASLKFPRLSKI